MSFPFYYVVKKIKSKIGVNANETGKAFVKVRAYIVDIGAKDDFFEIRRLKEGILLGRLQNEGGMSFSKKINHDVGFNFKGICMRSGDGMKK